jgi:hypothetical protein
MQLSHLAVGLFVLACAVGVLAWCVLLWSVLRVPFNLKPGVQAWSSGNPFNYLFKPEALTEAGLRARHRAGVALVVFVATVATAFLVAALAKAIT